MEISKNALKHLANSLFDYVTIESENGDLGSSLRIARNFESVILEEVEILRDHAKYEEDADYAKELKSIADYLEEVDTAEAAKATVKELMTFNSDAAEALALLIKAYNS